MPEVIKPEIIPDKIENQEPEKEKLPNDHRPEQSETETSVIEKTESYIIDKLAPEIKKWLTKQETETPSKFQRAEGTSDDIQSQIQENYAAAERYFAQIENNLPYLKDVQSVIETAVIQSPEDFESVSELLRKANIGLETVKQARRELSYSLNEEKNLVGSYYRTIIQETNLGENYDWRTDSQKISELKDKIYNLRHSFLGLGKLTNKSHIHELEVEKSELQEKLDTWGRAEKARSSESMDQMRLLETNLWRLDTDIQNLRKSVMDGVSQHIYDWYAPHLHMQVPPALELTKESLSGLNPNVSYQQILEAIVETSPQINEFNLWLDSLKHLTFTVESNLPIDQRPIHLQKYGSELNFQRVINTFLVNAPTPDAWVTFRKERESYIPEEKWRAAKELFTRAIIKKTMETDPQSDVREESIRLLQSFKSAEAAPLLLLNPFRYEHYQKIKPGEYGGEAGDMRDYALSLSENELVKIDQSNIPGLSEAVRTLRENSDTFNTPRVPNPELISAQEALINHPPIVRYLVGNWSEIKISDNVQVYYDSNTEIVSFSLERLKHLGAEIYATPGETIKDSDPRFYEIAKAFLNHHHQLNDLAKYPNFINTDIDVETGEPICELMQSSGGSRFPVMTVPSSLVENFLQQNDRPPNFFFETEAYVDNPAYQNLRFHIGKSVLHFLQNEGTKKFGAMVAKGLIGNNPAVGDFIRDIYLETDPTSDFRKILSDVLLENVGYVKNLPLSLAHEWVISGYEHLFITHFDSFDTENVTSAREFINFLVDDGRHLGTAFKILSESTSKVLQSIYRNGIPIHFAVSFLINHGNNKVVVENFRLLDTGDSQELTHNLVSLTSNLTLRETLELMDEYPQMAANLPWANGLRELEKIQGRVSNIEHDPWSQSLNSLVKSTASIGLISYEEPEDLKLVTDFVKEYGPVCTPNTFAIFVKLKRGELGDEEITAIKMVIGEKTYENLKDRPGQIFREIIKQKNKALSTMLQDEVPEILTNSLFGIEQLSSILGETNFKRSDDKLAIIQTWINTKTEHPELAELPNYYQEKTISVKKRETETQKLNPDQDEQIAKILNNPELILSYSEYLNGAKAIDRNSDEIYAELSSGLIKKLEENIEKSRVKLFQIEKPEARQGIEKNIGRMTEQLEAVRNLKFPSLDGGLVEREKELSAFMEEFATATQTISKEDEAKSILRALSWRHSFLIMGEGFRQAMLNFKNSEDKPDQTSLQNLHSLVADYFLEHYLNAAQEEHQVGHTPFSKNLLERLAPLFRLTNKGKENPVIKAWSDIGKITAGTVTEVTRDIALVPNQGLLRIFSGDIGDACYTSQHQMLAEGKVPNLHSISIVADRNTANERLVGSVLFIETKSEDGKRVLLVRANNPQENLIRSVDADNLIERIIGYAEEIAEKGKFDYIVVPRSRASSSSSNRPAVADYYARAFKNSPGIMLVQEPATEFNSYRVWEKDSPNSPVIIWSRKPINK